MVAEVVDVRSLTPRAEVSEREETRFVRNARLGLAMASGLVDLAGFNA